MKVLMIGDIVGRIGRAVIIEQLKNIRRDYEIDFVVANVENAAGGFGMLPYMGEEFLAAGVDIMTSGNHIFDKRDILEYIKDQPKLLRPANYPVEIPGSGVWSGKHKSIPIAVINLQGRVFMAPNDCPFHAVDRILNNLDKNIRIILVDHHAEATSEKMALGWYLDGRVSAVVGTHTHVPTADERILPKATAYITDLGMTGPYDSVIGIDKNVIIEKFISGLPRKLEIAERECFLCGVIIDINSETGQANSIVRVRVPYD
ncbi:MAG: TIGR00282 family metallophosphoesterase [Blastocatellia bacterium]|nr:TIGR00282 family metallophosphoesterase [Blastocatellia bacterium]MBN8724304.1 TIGR00282 family metallophosphoesterase [Acidobacteriota bacterium]